MRFRLDPCLLKTRRIGRLNSIMNPMDAHSYSRPDQVRVRHLDLDLNVLFERKTIEGVATVHFERISGDELILDTRGLTIHEVENAASFEVGPADPIFGAALRIRLG